MRPYNFGELQETATWRAARQPWQRGSSLLAGRETSSSRHREKLGEQKTCKIQHDFGQL